MAAMPWARRAVATMENFMMNRVVWCWIVLIVLFCDADEDDELRICRLVHRLYRFHSTADSPTSIGNSDMRSLKTPRSSHHTQSNSRRVE
jgi:hypothetical protein